MRFLQPNASTKNLKRDLNLRFSVLLSSFLLLLIVSYMFSSTTISSKKYDSFLINTAGLQRMLVHQYVSEINQTLIGLATSDFKMVLLHKKNADLSAQRFEKTMRAFINGGEISITSGWITQLEMEGFIEFTKKMIIIPPVADVETRHHLEHVNKEWNKLKRISLLSLRSNVHEISKSPYLRQLYEQTIKTVVEADHVVLAMQADSETRLDHLSNVLLLMIALGTLLFFILLYFVNKNIVLPLQSSIHILQDTTELLKIEKEHAESANNTKSEFLSCMSHELRTPMNAVLGFAQILEIDAAQLSKEQLGNVKEIICAGRHLMKLINDILDLSRIESGKLDIFIEDVNLDNVLEQSIALIQPLCVSRQIEITDNISEKGYSVKADNMRLKQVMLNLLSNAVKYNNDNGYITLNSELVGENHLRILITDSGDGISQDDINKLFTSFERLNKSNNVEGTGIGLVICKQIIELMSGTIGVKSILGEGSTFWVELELTNQDIKEISHE